MIVVDSLDELYENYEENEDELYHHGTKGMRWGIRRYQNADGSLTPAGRKRYMKDAKWRSKYERAVAKEKAKTAAREQKVQESAADRHARIMKSSDAKELYKNRSELSTEEINERINRIQAEQRLASYIQKEPTKMEKAMNRMNTAMNYANQAMSWANSPAGKLVVKGVKKQLGIKDTPKLTDYNEFLNSINSKSDKQVSEMLNRMQNEHKMKQIQAMWKQREMAERAAREQHNPDYQYTNNSSPVDNPFYNVQNGGDYRNGTLNVRRPLIADQPHNSSRDWLGTRGEDARQQESLNRLSSRINADREARAHRKELERQAASEEAQRQQESLNRLGQMVNENRAARERDRQRNNMFGNEPNPYGTNSPDVQRAYNPQRSQSLESNRVDTSNINNANQWNQVLNASTNTREAQHFVSNANDLIERMFGAPSLDDVRRNRLRHAEEFTDELFHHGIKGQKWGVRRFQDKTGRLTALGKAHVRDLKIDRKISEYVKSGKAKDTNLDDYKVAGLTSFTDKYGDQYVSGLINGHDFDWQEGINVDDGFIPTGDWLRGSDAKNIVGIHDANVNAAHDNFEFTDWDLKSANPDFGKPGTTQNCAKCSATLELRRRGIDIASGRQTYPSSADAQSLWFKDAKRVDYDYNSAQSALESYGSKTSGTLSIRYPNGAGGHAMHWSINGQGKFQIQDGQNGRTFDSIDSMMDEYGGDRSLGISTFRLDNCEPNWDALAQDSVVSLRNWNDDPEMRKLNKVRNKYSGKIVDNW